MAPGGRLCKSKSWRAVLGPAHWAVPSVASGTAQACPLPAHNSLSSRPWPFHCYPTPASDLPFSAPHGNGVGHGDWAPWLVTSARQAGFEGAEENASESKGKSCTDQQSKQRNKGTQTLELMPTQRATR